jgi:hypothetical protein
MSTTVVFYLNVPWGLDSLGTYQMVSVPRRGEIVQLRRTVYGDKSEPHPLNGWHIVESVKWQLGDNGTSSASVMLEKINPAELEEEPPG